MTHTALCTRRRHLAAASCPAAFSSWPTNVSARTFWYTLTPTFITTTRMPAEVACLTGPDSTAASGIVTTSPFGCRAAAWLL